jgi:hypothetical protein
MAVTGGFAWRAGTARETAGEFSRAAIQLDLAGSASRCSTASTHWPARSNIRRNQSSPLVHDVTKAWQARETSAILAPETRILPGCPGPFGPRENREAGAIPARARHCEWGATPRDATAARLEGAGKQRSTSQETCPGPLDHTLAVKRRVDSSYCPSLPRPSC